MNPDCGLENRGTEEVLAWVRDLLAAAAVQRRSIAGPPTPENPAATPAGPPPVGVS
ncbi:hypothetical protein, partial [Nocardia farcinica]|uniref:hypothetical protein n=1 Tax=Nocardia farcinica TaxID=37329 RepID=UPI003CC7D498